MTIRFTKGQGKPDTLACVRENGSCTWAALNYTMHDFGHYAIETTLGFRDAFFGLLSQGWAIDDFGRSDMVTGRKPSVPQAAQAEALACLLDIERHSNSLPDYAGFLERLASVCDGLALPVPAIEPSQLEVIRVCHTRLLRQWEQTAPGAMLELEF